MKDIQVNCLHTTVSRRLVASFNCAVSHFSSAYASLTFGSRTTALLAKTLYLVGDLPRQIKYASVSSVFLYKFSKPACMASEISENLRWFAIFVQFSCKYSRTGIVRHTVGSWELENDWWASDGSFPKLLALFTIPVNPKTYTQHLMHQLELLPVPFRQLEIGIGFSMKVRDFITIICTLYKTVNCLRKAVRGLWENTKSKSTCCRRRIRSRKLNNEAHRVLTQYRSWRDGASTSLHDFWKKARACGDLRICSNTLLCKAETLGSIDTDLIDQRKCLPNTIRNIKLKFAISVFYDFILILRICKLGIKLIQVISVNLFQDFVRWRWGNSANKVSSTQVKGMLHAPKLRCINMSKRGSNSRLTWSFAERVSSEFDQDPRFYQTPSSLCHCCWHYRR